MRSSYLTAGIKLPSLFVLLRRNNFSWRPKYLLRLLFILQSSLWATVFSFFEDIRYRKKIRQTPVPDDIIFIIGHWRTGSTYLHKLLSMDPASACPSLFQVALPDSFISSYNYFRPVMNAVISDHRPMDNVKLGINEPQEDEYAFYRITGFSPLEKLVFPDCSRYFLRDSVQYIPPDGGRKEWEAKVTDYFKKLSFHSGKRIISKNPFNSMRIRELMHLFPNARFIHIYRDPVKVIPSTIHMWDIVQKQNCMNPNSCRPGIHDVVEVYDHFMNTIRNDVKDLPPEKLIEVKYEDLEKDPLEAVKEIYRQFEMSFTPVFELSLKKCIADLHNYRKNCFPVSDEDTAFIRSNLGHHMAYYGYC